MAEELVTVRRATAEKWDRRWANLRIEGPGVRVQKGDDFLTAFIPGPEQQRPRGDRVPNGVLFAVKVEKDGGSDGSKTTVASWTYTVQDLAGNQLGTGVALTHPRPKGKAAYQTGTFSGGTAGYGTGFYDGTTFKLWSAGEVYGTGSCP